MKKLLTLLLPLLCLFLCHTAQAQIELRLEPARHDFVTGEGVALNLTLINQTDATINLDNVGGRPWLNILIYRAGQEMPVTPAAIARYPKLTLTPGSKRAFQINLKDSYKLDTSGSYRAIATIRDPFSTNTYSSNRAMFALINGGNVRTFQIQARGRRLEMSVRLAHVNGNDNLFGQVIDKDTNRVVGACFLGRYLNFIKPIVKLDAAQNLHVVCQSSPEFFTYAIMNTRGDRSHYQIYTRSSGNIDLVGGGKGLMPVGITPYVRKKEVKPQYHNISERPF